MRLRFFARSSLGQVLGLLLVVLPGISFLGLGSNKSSATTETIDAFVADLETVPQGDDAALVMSAFLKGLQNAKLLTDSSYDSKRHVARFRIAGGGAVGDFLPEYRIWLRILLGPKLQVSWEKTKVGVRLRFSGLHFAPLQGADELYVKAGLDSFTCASIKSVSQEEFYQCHLKKASVQCAVWAMSLFYIRLSCNSSRRENGCYIV